jgi:polysaccharide biosynthesis protein PslG
VRFARRWRDNQTGKNHAPPHEHSALLRFVPRSFITLALFFSLIALGLTLHASSTETDGSNARAASVKSHPTTVSSDQSSIVTGTEGPTSPVATSTTITSTTAGRTPVTAPTQGRSTPPLVAAAHQETLTPTTTTTTTTAASTPSASGGPVFGISIPALIAQKPATQAAWLANIKSIGITSVRIGADWAWIQPGGPTSYDWSQLDQEVASIRAAGFSIDLVISGAPPWAAVPSVADDSSPQPADPAAFGAFAGAVAARYGPQGIRDFEIWNEPNSEEFWQPAPNPAAYTADLTAAHLAIKAVDPEGVVITGGLAPETSDGTNINAVTFLQDMYADGAKGAFDAVGYHPYSYPALPDTYEIWSGWSQMSQTPASIESVLAANGDASEPLWLTEVGAPTNGPDGVGTAGQAEELAQAIADAKSSSFIGSLYIYTYEDAGTDPTTDEDWFGLLSADGTPKPSFEAVAAALS